MSDVRALEQSWRSELLRAARSLDTRRPVTGRPSGHPYRRAVEEVLTELVRLRLEDEHGDR